MEVATKKRVRSKPFSNKEIPHVAAHFAQQYVTKERRVWLVADFELHKGEDNRYYSILGTFLSDHTIARRVATDKYLKEVLKASVTRGTILKKITKWVNNRMKK